MLEIMYRELRIEPTLDAVRELIKYKKDLYDVLEILEEGYDCAASKRKRNIVERCLRKGKKEFKVVLAKTEVVYPDNYKERIWRLIHFGQYTYKKRK